MAIMGIRRSSRLSRVVLGAALCCVLAACGSNLDPADVVTGTGPGSGSGFGAGDGAGAAPGSLLVDSGDGVLAPGGAADLPGSSDLGTPFGQDDTTGRDTPGEDLAAPDDPDPTVPGDVTGDDSPSGDDSAVSCDGFANTTGITDDTITIGNASDISGPVPGLFAESQTATAAYVEYFNSTGTKICGRRLALARYDSRTDAGADQQSYAKACDEVFAMVGSMSGFDSGGAATAEECGLPDIRAISVTKDRTACSTCYAAQPAGPDEFENAVPDFIMRNYGGGQKAAMLYLNGGAAAENGPSQAALETKRGMKFVYVASIDLAEFNYAPYVQAMKDKGVETVQFIGANPQFVRLAQAMQQQGFKPKLYLLDPTAYSTEYTGPAGSAAEDTVVFMNFTPFEEASDNAELNLYVSYLEQSSPGAKPGFFGLFAWSAARLFVEQATGLGGGLTRQSLVDSMRSVRDWTSNGLHAPQQVGLKRIAECWRFITWDGSDWNAREGTKYQCSGTTTK